MAKTGRLEEKSDKPINIAPAWCCLCTLYDHDGSWRLLASKTKRDVSQPNSRVHTLTIAVHGCPVCTRQSSSLHVAAFKDHSPSHYLGDTVPDMVLRALLLRSWAPRRTGLKRNVMFSHCRAAGKSQGVNRDVLIVSASQDFMGRLSHRAVLGDQTAARQNLSLNN